MNIKKTGIFMLKDKELVRLVTQFRKGILQGKSSNKMCFAVCSPLSTYLRLSGQDNHLVSGLIKWGTPGEWEHTWLELPDGRIIDPTADQFTTPAGETMPPVYLGEKPEWYS